MKMGPPEDVGCGDDLNEGYNNKRVFLMRVVVWKGVRAMVEHPLALRCLGGSLNLIDERTLHVVAKLWVSMH